MESNTSDGGSECEGVEREQGKRTSTKGSDMAEPPKTDLKAKAIDWAFQQGVSTVLLLLLAGGGFYYTPQWLKENRESIQAGYEKLATQNRETIKDRDASYERSIKALTDSWDREREFLRERDRRFGVNP